MLTRNPHFTRLGEPDGGMAAAEGITNTRAKTGKGADALEPGLSRPPHWLLPVSEVQHRDSKLDLLSRDLAFVSGLMAQGVPFMVAEPERDAHPSCCTSMPFCGSGREGAAADIRAHAGCLAGDEACGELAGQSDELASRGRGGPRGSKAGVDQFVRGVLPILDAVLRSGAETLAEIAAALNHRGVRSASGGKGHRSAVRNPLARAHSCEG